MGKKLTHNEFLEVLRDKNESYQKGEFEVVGDYTKRKSRILVMDRYGTLSVIAESLLLGVKPSIQCAIDPTQYYINRFKEVHGERYNYSFVNYIDTTIKINIFCPIHNSFFTQTPPSHLYGSGCPKCGNIAIGLKQYSSLEEFIKKAKLIHGDNRYNYNIADYVRSSKKVDIICPEHGVYKCTPNNHLKGKGCPQCGHQYNSYIKSEWIKSAGNKQGIFYIIKCWNDNEEFYKVGITHNGVHKRYAGKEAMPYVYEIIREIYSDDKELIWNMEKESIKKLKDYHYSPLTPFSGSKYECFYHIPENLLKGKI